MERQGYKGIYFLHEPMNKEKLKCSIYQKPIDKNNLIPAASFHASAMKKGLPFIQILRVKIICSNSDENKQKINEVILTYFESEAWKEGRDSITQAKEMMTVMDGYAWWMRKTYIHI